MMRQFESESEPASCVALSLTAVSNKGETLSLETSVIRRQVQNFLRLKIRGIACAVKSKRLALALEFHAMMAQGTLMKMTKSF